MALLGLIVPQGVMGERGDAAAIDAFWNYIVVTLESYKPTAHALPSSH